MKTTIDQRLAKMEAAQRAGRTTTLEGLGDDMGGGATYCGNCNVRVPDYKGYGDDCDACGHTFNGMNITPYPYGGSDY